MGPADSRTHAAFDAATRRIGATVAAAAAKVAEMLGVLATASVRIAERDHLNVAQFELRRHATAFREDFATALREKVASELAPREDGARRRTGADWQSLSLVDDAEMEERMFADRLGHAISHACDAELRELAGYMASVLPAGPADVDRHPLRAEIVGTLVHRSIEAVTRDAEPRKLLAREFGRALERAMPACYADIVRDLQALGVRPAALTARSVEGPGTGYATLPGPDVFDAGSSSHPIDALSARGGPRRSTRGGLDAGESTAPAALADAQADAALMSLLRRLTTVGGVPGGGDPAPALARPASPDIEAPGVELAPHPPAHGLMAANLIRAHRAELLQASTGQLDHLVIDVVGSLFDQILSDTRVPPQMARQIARLQLPVLRVALADAAFFSSRRHPVRRFVNRMASLACAFDDFESGPGQQFLARIHALVQQIVNGDFDRIDLYVAKLGDLERFIGEQTGERAAEGGTAVALERKETELRLQQRCRSTLQSALAPLALPDWLGEFLQQVWSQALVLAAGEAGSDRAQRYRRAGRDLVLSIQPKGSPGMRKKFLLQLPPLMKDLQEGMALVGWPASAQQRFLGQLMSTHAEALKLAPLSELDHNLLAKRLESVFAVAAADDAGGPPPPPLLAPADAAAPEPRFSAEEARAVGLVPEATVDWSRAPVDIDLGAEADAPTTGSPAIDIDLGTAAGAPSAEAPEPTTGAALMEHVKLGFAYRMQLQDEWQKVRLTHVSTGRGFFVFSHGKHHQETLSMTARMLARMCAAGRFRAVERGDLMERATQRARRQLAALKVSEPA